MKGIRTAILGDTVCLRIAGQGNMNNALAVREFCSEMISMEYSKIVMDLHECTGVDSTFMGMMLCIAQDIDEINKENNSGRHKIVDEKENNDSWQDLDMQDEHADGGYLLALGASEKIRDLLENLGVAGFIRILNEECPALPHSPKMVPLPAAKGDSAQRIKTIHEAHERLVRVDESNKERFGVFLKQLKKEMDLL